MNLFSEITHEPINLLPYDGTVVYFGRILDSESINVFYNQLLVEIPWQSDEVMMFGKRIIMKRKMAWFADDGISYTYASSRKEALPWTETLLKLKQIVSDSSGHTYNSCLLNLYQDGEQAMGWHADNEKQLLKNGAIASVSLGAERKFAFKHRTNADRVDVVLENGSLLLMKDETQQHWLHRLPPTKRVKSPRINLTFRTILPC